MRKPQREHLESVALSLYHAAPDYQTWFLDVSLDPNVSRAIVLLQTLSDGQPRSMEALSETVASNPHFATLTEGNRRNEVSHILNALLVGGVPFTSVSGFGARQGIWALKPNVAT